MSKCIWVIANWKSNKTISEAVEWIAEVGPRVPKRKDVKVVVCPTFSALSEVKKAIQAGNFPIMVGSQDISSFGIGAYTGEEPAELLKPLVRLSIIGHSERRQNFSETDEMVDQKVKKTLENAITPLVCVQSEKTPVPEGCGLVAYEPIFAIGTGNADTPENASAIAQSLKSKYGESLEVLYGGSVNSDNINSFIDQSNISGVLVGKWSLDVDKFIQILEKVSA